MIIHALLDSASLTGAFHFTLRAGDATIIDTELTLIARVAVDHLGLGAMTATYRLRRRSTIAIPTTCARPSTTSAGCRFSPAPANGCGGRSPIATTLQISAFADVNPRGFGLLQRARDFDAFDDDDAHWELRPSLWIEPIGDWGEGEVILLEIPSDSENNDNIIAQWRPKAGLAEGATVSFAYRQFWCWTPPARPPLATVVEFARAARLGKRRRFVVEFVADLFADPQKAARGERARSPPRRGRSSRRASIAYKERRSIRVVFDLDPGSESYSELRLRAQGRRSARQRDMALSMDSLTTPDARSSRRRRARRRWRCRCSRCARFDRARAARAGSAAQLARCALAGAAHHLRRRVGADRSTARAKCTASSRSARSRRSNGRWSCCSSSISPGSPLAFTSSVLRLRLARLRARRARAAAAAARGARPRW